MSFKRIFLLASAFLPLTLFSQIVDILTSGTNNSFRGLSAVNDSTVWVSGTNGTVGKSLNGGRTWEWYTVRGFEKTDFRDIEAFDEKKAIIMGISEPAYILMTVNGGKDWKVVYENKDKGMFLDAMEFWNKESGIVIGDPVNNKMFVARTFDGGNTWQKIPENKLPVADSGEACFASSGTNVRKINKKEAVFVTGGSKSNLFIRDEKKRIPIIQGKETTGANSIAVKDARTYVIVGGDFLTKDSTNSNCIITFDKGQTWIAPAVPPHGYRSCVEWLWKDTWITCGLNGIDLSTDNGSTWKWISKEGFHVCRKAKKGKTVFFAGSSGKVGRLTMED